MNPSTRLRTLAVAGLAGVLAVTASPAPAADVNRSPKAFISGGATALASPRAVTVDAAGNRYVVDTGSLAVLVFAPGATGNAAPTRTISGAATQLTNPQGLLVAGDGRLFVGNVDPGGVGKVIVFAPGANGNATPVDVITGPSTTLGWPTDLEFDALGRLYVTDRANNAVVVFAPGAGGSATPIRRLAGAATGLSEPNALALRPDGTLHVVGVGNNALTTYAPGANGNAAPIRTVQGPATGLSAPTGLDLDASDRVYVSNLTGNSITAYAPGAAGNVAPLDRLVGGNTDLAEPAGVVIGPQSDVTVVNRATSSVITFASFVTSDPGAPSAVRKVRVVGKPAAAKRTVRWSAPDSNGGAALTAYRVVVKKGTRSLLTKTVGPTRTSVVVKRAKLRDGRHKVIVVAVNSAGSSPRASATFTVRK